MSSLNHFQSEIVIFISTPRLGKKLGVLNKKKQCVLQMLLLFGFWIEVFPEKTQFINGIVI